MSTDDFLSSPILMGQQIGDKYDIVDPPRPLLWHVPSHAQSHRMRCSGVPSPRNCRFPFALTFRPLSLPLSDALRPAERAVLDALTSHQASQTPSWLRKLQNQLSIKIFMSSSLDRHPAGRAQREHELATQMVWVKTVARINQYTS